MNISQSARSANSIGRKVLTVLLWLLLLGAPFISVGLLQLITGTGPANLDAYNTTWNDEIGYYRVIQLLRTDLFPRGMYGFNEVAPSHLAYGPYNIFTYIPYLIMSFATGFGSHNFFYWCNVILAVLAMFLFVVLVQPKIRESLWILAFLVSYLIMGRYIWSGMSECSYNLYLILFTALALWAVQEPDADSAGTKWALSVMILTTFFWNTMRPYYFPLLIIPIYFAWRRRSPLTTGAKIFFTFLSAAAAAGSVGLFYFFLNYNVARYFSEVSQTETLRRLLGSGSLTAMVRQILDANLTALHDVWHYVKRARWAGIVSLLYYAQSLLLFILLIRTFFFGTSQQTDDSDYAYPGEAMDTGTDSVQEEEDIDSGLVQGAAETAFVSENSENASFENASAARDGSEPAMRDGSEPAMHGDSESAVRDDSVPEMHGESVPAASDDSAENKPFSMYKGVSNEPTVEEDLSRYGAVIPQRKGAQGDRSAQSSVRRFKPEDGRCFVLFAMLGAGLVIYEANVVLYSPEQLHRMMLAITIIYSLVLIMLGGFEKIVNEAVILLLIGFLLIRVPQNFGLPQVNEHTASAQQEQALRDHFEEILPLEIDPWDNTICKLVEEKDLQWEFMLPDYIALNVCKRAKMIELLETDTLRSKYVLLETSSDLNEMCQKKKYKVIWEGYDRLLYQVR